MKNLIIYAHPKTGGHCEALLKEAQNQLEEFEMIDLYKIKYDPVLHEDEHYTNGGKTISAQNKKYQDKIKKAQNLIFIYPTWWGNPPAILKGFIEKVFTSHFAFVYQKNRPVGFLKGKKAIAITTAGSPKFFARIIELSCIRSITLSMFFCGIKSKGFILGKCREFDKKRNPEIKKLVKKALRFIRN